MNFLVPCFYNWFCCYLYYNYYYLQCFCSSSNSSNSSISSYYTKALGFMDLPFWCYKHVKKHQVHIIWITFLFDNMSYNKFCCHLLKIQGQQVIAFLISENYKLTNSLILEPKYSTLSTVNYNICHLTQS